MPNDPFLLPPDAGERIGNPLGGEIVFKARADRTAGAMTVFEAVNRPGQGPPLHLHESLDEAIYLIDGGLRVRLADAVEEVASGAFVFIPRGVPHTWQAVGETEVRFLVVLAPAGLEDFFTATAEAGGAQGDRGNDPFERFGGTDLTTLGPPLAVTHPL